MLPGEGATMSERSELEKRAAELSEDLGVGLGSKRLSTMKLAERVEELEQRKAEQDAGQREETIVELHRARLVERLHQEADEQRGAGMRYAYQVAPDKQLHCRIGVLKSGVQVKREWVGGIAALDDLVDLGTVLQGPLAKRFEVAENRQLDNTTRGTLKAGARVEPEYVGGEHKLEALIREGHVKRNQLPPER